MRWTGLLGCLPLIVCHGFQGSFQIGLQVPLHFGFGDNSEKALRIATINVALSVQQPNSLKQRLHSKSDF